MPGDLRVRQQEDTPVSETMAWRTITKIAAGIDRIDAHLTQVEEKVSELATTVARLTIGQAASSRPAPDPEP